MGNTIKTRGSDLPEMKDAFGRDIARIEGQERKFRNQLKKLNPVLSNTIPSHQSGNTITIVDKDSPEIYFTVGKRRFKVLAEEVR